MQNERSSGTYAAARRLWTLRGGGRGHACRASERLPRDRLATRLLPAHRARLRPRSRLFFRWLSTTSHALAEVGERALLDYVAAQRAFFVVLKGKQRGHPMTSDGLRSLLRYRRRNTELSNANAHRFRHTFGADMARAGVRLPILQRMMGPRREGPPEDKRLLASSPRRWSAAARADQRAEALIPIHVVPRPSNDAGTVHDHDIGIEGVRRVLRLGVAKRSFHPSWHDVLGLAQHLLSIGS